LVIVAVVGIVAAVTVLLLMFCEPSNSSLLHCNRQAEESQEVVDSFFKDANTHFGDESRAARQLDRISTVFEGRVKSSSDVSRNTW
jgi:hypothetical protein